MRVTQCLARLMPVVLLITVHGEEKPTSTKPETPVDPVKVVYSEYKPDFLGKVVPGTRDRGYKEYQEKMKLSSEKHYFTLNLIDEDSRANALVQAALAKEKEGQFREALKMYQIVIDKYQSSLYRVSSYGVFIPIAQYCQRRILRFPSEDLAFYRTRHDARAKEAFEQAQRKHSLIGLAEVYGNMLATSYGGKAALELGNAALDKGHYLEALEYFTTVRDFFPDRVLLTADLQLKMAYCVKLLGRSSGKAVSTDARTNVTANGSDRKLTGEQLRQFEDVIKTVSFQKPPFHTQGSSLPHVAADDYTLLPPTSDPMALKPPVWKKTLPGSRRDFFVYTQPVVTDRSIIYRHKNIIYCRSILNGEMRWKSDLGGRVIWQDWNARQYPLEDLLVQDGMVITPMYKIGESLVALDEVTGQMKWAYGPMVASTPQEARMRFGAAPAGGPRTIFVSYILDNIEGQTHIDSEYGLIAFESTTGRILWRTPICTLRPGKFAGAFRMRRNRIRSFNSPPLYHQGTVYHTTNAGAIAAVDALSGRIKWLMRYPYRTGVHDATRQYSKLSKIHGGTEYVRPHFSMFWLNQRPLLVDDWLYVLPVDSKLMYAINRRTGAVKWSKGKVSEGFNYMLGTMQTGELVIAGNGRNGPQFGSSRPSGPPVHLLNPDTGETVWKSPDLVLRDEKPVMNHYIYYSPAWFGINTRWFELAARPFMTADGKLYVTSWTDCSVYWRPGCHVFNLAEVNLKSREVTQKRRYYTGALLTHCHGMITDSAPKDLEQHEKLPAKDDKIKHRIKVMKEIVADTVPVNQHGAFMPFSRITFSRYGIPFELRMGPRTIQMVYDIGAVRQSLGRSNDPDARFAKAELALADARLDDSASHLRQCLLAISSEDLDFRAAINQQLFQVQRELARSAIRAARPEQELANVLGMSRTANTLAEEVETLFALSEAYERKGDIPSAARALRSIISTYGHYEYPVPALFSENRSSVERASAGVFDRFGALSKLSILEKEMTDALNLMRNGLPLYFSTLSPLEKTLTLRAGEFAAARLAELQERSPDFDSAFENQAKGELDASSPDERLFRLWEFPGTEAGQSVIDELFNESEKQKGPSARLLRWRLADAARVSRLAVPKAYKASVSAPATTPALSSIQFPIKEQKLKLEGQDGTAWLVLERRGQRARHPDMLFIGGRVRKRFDNKFIVMTTNVKTGGILWKTPPFRLKGKGEEAGFFEAFVHDDLVIVHGLYDVIAFRVSDGREVWRYRVPFDFEIKNAVMSGDLLILAGKAETMAIYLPTENSTGEVAWQEKEEGDIYAPPYFQGDRLVSVRKLPFAVTVRYRATGKLIGRLALPDLSLHEKHPLLEKGPAALPVAHDANLLIVTDGWYYINIDIEKMRVIWKRLIDQNDPTREPAMRFALEGDYLAVTKEDFDQKTIYMISSRTGDVLWNTDVKVGDTPRPMFSMMIQRDTLYGLQVHPGQGYYWSAMNCRTGKQVFKTEVKGYQARPEVRLVSGFFGEHVIAMVKDRQDFELKVLGLTDGKAAHTLKEKGVGTFGEHGRVSATIQNGTLVLLSKDSLTMGRQRP